jgi:hypothetical protein
LSKRPISRRSGFRQKAAFFSFQEFPALPESPLRSAAYLVAA